MTDSITITIPAISNEAINALQTAQQQEHETVTKALAAIRENYSALAKHNGFVRIAYSYVGNSNFSNEKEKYYEKNGKRVRALLAIAGFKKEYSDQNRGSLVGSNLYLTEDGEWLKITRSGNWSAWQGEPEGWGCGVSADDGSEDEEYGYEREPYRVGGSIDVLTDEQIEDEYDIEQLVEKLSESLADLAAKIPERMNRVQKRTEIAAQLLAGLSK